MIGGFSVSAYLLFGLTGMSFSSTGKSFVSVVLMISGSYDYDSMKAADALAAPIFFIVFMTVVYIILLRMFVAILNGHYHEMKGDGNEVRYL